MDTLQSGEEFFVLPYPDDLPSQRGQSLVNLTTALHVPLKFGFPIVIVRKGDPPMVRAAMPEASVNEDSEPRLREYNVDTDNASFR